MTPELPVRFSSIRKRYRSTLAIDDLTVDVRAGQVFALLGENGAGKTTAIRILMGMVDPDCGSSHVLGFNSATHHLRIRQLVGYVSDSPGLYGWMTVEEIGWFAAGFYPDGFQAEYRRLAAGFELEGRHQIKTLSKGMRAKVALALALAHQPELLILDEPTSGLDTLVRRDFLESMVDIASTGRTVFLSSHQIPEVERVADTVAIMSHGRLLAVEQMDHLKRTTSQVILTVSGELPTDLALPNIVHQQRQGRQIRYLVRHEDELDLTSISAHRAVQAVEVLQPSLEEIYVAYMRSATNEHACVTKERVVESTTKEEIHDC